MLLSTLHRELDSFLSPVAVNSGYDQGVHCLSDLLNKCKIKQYVDLMQKKYITYWNHTLQHSQKLNFYYKIKTNYSPSVYLDLTRKNGFKRLTAKEEHSPKIVIRVCASQRGNDFEAPDLERAYTYFFPS